MYDLKVLEKCVFQEMLQSKKNFWHALIETFKCKFSSYFEKIQIYAGVFEHFPKMFNLNLHSSDMFLPYLS